MSDDVRPPTPRALRVNTKTLGGTMQFRMIGRGRRGLALLATLTVIGTVGVRAARASDHQDNPLVELNPTFDMTDFYAFPGSAADRIALVLNTHPFLTPAATPSATFDPDVLYQFKIDNNGDAKEDLVIQVIFKGAGASQTVEVRGPIAPPVVGPMGNTVATSAPTVTGAINTVLGTATGMQVYAGARDDPFFLDLEQFFRIIPDRRPSTGAFSLLPDTATAGTFRTAAAAVDYLKGFNVMSIVVELPTAQLTAGGTAKVGLWGTTSR
jgi:hypothetical protein